MQEQQKTAQEFSAIEPVSVKRRSVVLAIVFSIITLGIYAIYWFVCLTNDTNKLSRYKTASGGLAVLFTVLTLGIYGIYWSYMLGKKVGDFENETSAGILYLILDLIGFGIIAYALAQSALNKRATR